MQQNKKKNDSSFQPFAYKFYLINGKKHIEFPSKVVFPLDMLKTILSSCDKKKIKKDDVLISCFLPIPKNTLKSQSTKFIAKEKNAEEKN
jgi:hypothetical protein